MDKEVIEELLNKGYASVKIDGLSLVILTIPFAEKIGFKTK